MLDICATVYRKHRLWSILELKAAMEESLLSNSELVLIWVDPGRFCILRKKRCALIKPPEFAGHVTVDPEAEDRPLGTIINYDELRELYLDKSPK